MKFIQLSGVARVGKTTTANILFDVAYDNGFIPVIVPFAKSLKNEALERGYTKDDNPEKYRAFCQEWGAKRRLEDSDYWVKKTKEEVDRLRDIEVKLRKTEDRFEHIIIQDDVRYMNELAFGREVGAYQIFVSCGSRKIPDMLGTWRLHESEELAMKVEAGVKSHNDLFHEYLVNYSTMENLIKRIRGRFFTWITESEVSEDTATSAYRKGLAPNLTFVALSEVYEQMNGMELDDSLYDFLKELNDDGESDGYSDNGDT